MRKPMTFESLVNEIHVFHEMQDVSMSDALSILSDGKLNKTDEENALYMSIPLFLGEFQIPATLERVSRIMEIARQ